MSEIARRQSLEGEATASRLELDRLKQEHERAKHEIAGYLEDLKTGKEKAARYQKEAVDRHDTAGKLKSLLDAEIKKNARLKETLEEIRNEVEVEETKLKQQRNSLADKLRAKEFKAATAATSLAEAERKLRVAEETCRNIRSKNEELSVTLQKIEQDVDAVKAEYDALKDDRMGLATALEALQQERAKLEELLSQKEGECRAQAADIERLQRAQDIMSQDAIAMTRKLKEKDHSDQEIVAQLKDLEEAFLTLNVTHKEVVEQLTTAKSQVKRLQGEVDACKRSHLDELKGFRAEAASLQVKYEGKTANLTQEVASLKAQLANSEENSSKLVNDHGFKELQIRRSASEIAAWKLAMLDLLLRDSTQKPIIESRLRSLLGIKPEYTLEADAELTTHINGVACRIGEILFSQKNEVQADLTHAQTQALLSEMTTKYRREMAERRRLHNQLQELRGNVRVMCRVRPRLSGELAQEECVLATDLCQIKVYNSQSMKESNFEFDRVFLPTDTQEVVYYEVNDLVTSVMDGFNVCILAYGQTGSGKTFTMEGDHCNLGINYRALKELFEIIETRCDAQYSLSISILEVYNEQIRNLLDGTTRLDIREDTHGSPQLPGLDLLQITDYQDVIRAMRQGSSNRSVGTTLMNEVSSRSHCVVTIYVTGRLPDRKVHSKLNLIDLAGSERVWKSEAEGQRMVEACNINQSLSALGKVLYSLAAKQPHIPYRDSKLTHLLKDSLAGDAKTLMIVTVSPLGLDFAESTSSLQFGSRVAFVEKGRAKSKGKENIKRKAKKA